MQLLTLITFLLSFAQLFDSIKSNTTGIWLIVLNGSILFASSFPIILGTYEIMTSEKSKLLRTIYGFWEYLYPDDLGSREFYKKMEGDSIFCNPFRNRATFCTHSEILKLIPKLEGWDYNEKMRGNKIWQAANVEIVMGTNWSSELKQDLLGTLPKSMEVPRTRRGELDVESILNSLGADIVRGETTYSISNLPCQISRIIIEKGEYFTVEMEVSIDELKMRLECFNKMDEVPFGVENPLDKTKCWARLSCFHGGSDKQWAEKDYSEENTGVFGGKIINMAQCFGFLARNNRVCCFVSNEKIMEKKNFFTKKEYEVHHCVSLKEMIEGVMMKNMQITLVRASRNKIFEGEEEGMIKSKIKSSIFDLKLKVFESKYGKLITKCIKKVIEDFGIDGSGMEETINCLMNNELPRRIKGVRNWERKKFLASLSWLGQKSLGLTLKGAESKVKPPLRTVKFFEKEFSKSSLGLINLVEGEDEEERAKCYNDLLMKECEVGRNVVKLKRKSRGNYELKGISEEGIIEMGVTKGGGYYILNNKKLDPKQIKPIEESKMTYKEIVLKMINSIDEGEKFDIEALKKDLRIRGKSVEETKREKKPAAEIVVKREETGKRKVRKFTPKILKATKNEEDLTIKENEIKKIHDNLTREKRPPLESINQYNILSLIIETKEKVTNGNEIPFCDIEQTLKGNVILQKKKTFKKSDLKGNKNKEILKNFHGAKTVKSIRNRINSLEDNVDFIYLNSIEDSIRKMFKIISRNSLIKYRTNNLSRQIFKGGDVQRWPDQNQKIKPKKKTNEELSKKEGKGGVGERMESREGKEVEGRGKRKSCKRENDEDLNEENCFKKKIINREINYEDMEIERKIYKEKKEEKEKKNKEKKEKENEEEKEKLKKKIERNAERRKEANYRFVIW